MYTVIMLMAVSGPADVGQCNARASSCAASSCASVQRVLVVRLTCSAASSCSGRVGIFQRHRERVADRRATRGSACSAGVVIMEPVPAPTPTPQKKEYPKK